VLLFFKIKKSAQICADIIVLFILSTKKAAQHEQYKNNTEPVWFYTRATGCLFRY
jgi:uncharacterized membrane protein YozB (DUF420 family)